MFSSRSLLAISLCLGWAKGWGESSSSPIAPPLVSSTWTGNASSSIMEEGNWTGGTPYGETAVFNGNGDNSPFASQGGSFEFEQVQFTAATEVSVITELEISGEEPVLALPGITATFDIYEYQPMIWPPAALRITAGAAASGGGIVNYNLNSYGELYAYAGSTEETVVNVTMTGGNNYFEINGPGSNVFDNLSSDSETDQIQLASGSNLTIQTTASHTIEGVISGSGSFTKSGTGSLIFNNDNTYTGVTTINGGVLEVNGNLTSDVTVEIGGILKGVGSIEGTLFLSGTVAPGNSIGILTVADFSATDSSVTAYEISSSGSSDLIVSTGSVSLGGTLQIIPLDLSFAAPINYQIFQASTAISGSFSLIQSTVPSLKFLSYGATTTSLKYLPISAIPLSGNAAKAADCFGTLSSADVNTVSGQILSLPLSSMQNTFNQLQPSQLSAQSWVQFSNALLIRLGYLKHLEGFSLNNGCERDSNTHLWIDGLGSWEKQKKDQHQLGYTDWMTGFSLGGDAQAGAIQLGAAASYTYADLGWSYSAGNSQIQSGYAGLYGGWGGDQGYVHFSTLGSYNHYQSSRHLSIGNIRRHAASTHHGWEFLTGVAGGFYFHTNKVKMGPFGRLDYLYLWQQGYQESGADSLNLNIKSRQDQLLQTQIGFMFTDRYACGTVSSTGTLHPYLELSYINQTELDRKDYQASFKNSSCEFNVKGWRFNRNLGAVGLKLTYLTPSEKIGVSLQYDGQFGVRYTNQSGNLLFDIKY